MELKYSKIGIEVTRKCNQKCEGFCMRGDKQNLDINLEFIDKLLNNDFSLIETLFFSGGEPTLNDQAISYTIDKIVERNIPVMSVSLITNGLNYSQVLVDSFEKFNDYANMFVLTELEKRNMSMKAKDNFKKNFFNQWASISFSNDHYHKSLDEEVLKKYYNNSKNIIFSMTGDKKEENLLRSGYSTIGRSMETVDKCVRIFGDTVIDIIYLTAKGNLACFGDGSFDEIDYYSEGNSVLNTELDEFCFYNMKDTSRPTKQIKKYLKKR